MDVSVVVPVFNEFGNLRRLVEELTNALEPLKLEYELILVDDGSSDGSADLLRALSLEYSCISGHSLKRNYGQTAALSYGMNSASGAFVITIDADLQNDPADIPHIIELLEQGHDFVSGWRRDRQDPLVRSVLSRMANRLISRYSSVTLHDYGCTLKGFRAEKIEKLQLYGEMHRFIPIYMDDAGAKSVEIVVNHRERTWGKSKYGFGRILKVFVDLLVVLFLRRYLARPMHIFGLLGVLSILASLISLICAIFLRVVGYATFVQTPLPLLSGVFLVGGITSWLLGLQAELLVRIFFSLEPRRAVDGEPL
jgi:glycosyltransferase involved in cell wall biosynthesis